ncbi:MAG: HAD-IB family phosphatase [Lutispora sp.]|nr:HAD-IB family phosphatase [Lutispora sp.]MDD4835107.1 HAD-IB family phosphatase [Lutispora sp.]
MKSNINFAFDLDGTVTKQEMLPILARELGLEEEMKILTDLTLKGIISFEHSFKLRVAILKAIPISKIHKIVESVDLDENIKEFIVNNKDLCSIVTGNLDIWVLPIMEKLKCKLYSSKAIFHEDRLIGIEEILIKDRAILDIKKNWNKVVTIGESINDIPMFKEGDIGISYGGVHEPVKEILEICDYVVYKSQDLCDLLYRLKLQE